MVRDRGARAHPARDRREAGADIRKAVGSPDGRKKMEDAGFRVTGTTGAEFARIIAADTASWGKAVAATGFKAD